MEKKKKIMLISSIIALIIIIVGSILIVYFNTNNGGSNQNRLNVLYDTLSNKQEYSFSIKLNDENQVYYAKKDNKAYIKEIYESNQDELIVKDGNTYLLLADDKEYYTYQNNESQLNEFEDILSELKEEQSTQGKEKINNKKYYYEEYNILTDFSFEGDSDIENNEDIKTRFYFDGNTLKYIKTIIGNQEELLSVQISDDTQDGIFEIPEGYQEM